MTGPKAQGRYQVSAVHGDLVLTAGLTPRDSNGRLIVTGRVGDGLPYPDAVRAARQAARNAAATVAEAAGGRDNVTRLLRLTVYIACADGFTRHSELADEVSAELAETLRLTGQPVRTAVGVRSLPGGAPIEVEVTAVRRTQERLPRTVGRLV
jgi:enamine deaminase RidA (YjgF/YER057c/UK114 family)